MNLQPTNPMPVFQPTCIQCGKQMQSCAAWRCACSHCRRIREIGVKKPKRKLDASDRATIIAALRLFRREYEGLDADRIRGEQIIDDWDCFADQENNQFIEPLGSDDIDVLCRDIERGAID